MMTKNPSWTREELILALDLYFRLNPSHVSQSHPEILELSSVLNRLPTKLIAVDTKRFRNPNGVYMKLCNFLPLDPTYKGKGLTRGGKLEVVIWNEFANNRKYLTELSESIRFGVNNLTKSEIKGINTVEEDEEFPEGLLLTTLHKYRERHPNISKKKKQKVLLETGCLACEVCNFDFHSFYGDLGFGVAECHHKVPLSTLTQSRKTRLSDLAIVCANCHRVIHKSHPIITIEKLRDYLISKNYQQ